MASRWRWRSVAAADVDAGVGRVHLEKGRKVALNITYGSNERQAARRTDLGESEQCAFA